MDSRETFREKLEYLKSLGWYPLYIDLLLRYGKANKADMNFIDKLYDQVTKGIQ